MLTKPTWPSVGGDSGIWAPKLNAALDALVAQLTNLDNTSDAAKPVSTQVAVQLATKAPIASPAFAGIPTTPTATAGTNSAQIASTAFVATALGGVSGGTVADATSTIKGIVRLAGDLTGTATTPALAPSGVTAGTYGNSSAVPVLTIDAKGRITGASSAAVSGGGGSSAAPFGIFRPEAYGAVADGTTNDSAAFTNCMAAASAASTTAGTPATVMLTTGRAYRISSTIIVPAGGNVRLEGNGAALVGPITGAAPISSSNNPSVPAASDIAGQTAGACFSDSANLDAAIYGLSFRNMRIFNFRYGFVNKCVWAYSIHENVIFEGCNIGQMAYQGSQQQKMLSCISQGGGGVTFVAAATGFASGNPRAGLDNYFCDGFVYDSIGLQRDSGVSNSTFDTWFSAAIMRPTALSYSAGTPSGSTFYWTDTDTLAVTGRLIYVPQRNGRTTFSMNIRRADPENCARGAVLVANPAGLQIDNVSGENCFANGPQSMVVILLGNGFSPSGSLRNVDASLATNTSKYAVEFRLDGGSWSDAGNIFVENVKGQNYDINDPWINVSNRPWLLMKTPAVTRQYYDHGFSSSTLANVDALGFTAPANAEVSFRATIFFATSGSNYNGRFTVNGPSNSLLDYRVQQSTGSSTVAVSEGLSAYQQPASAPSTSPPTNQGVAIVEGIVRTSVAGRVQIQAASGSNGNAITVRRGSHMAHLYSAYVQGSGGGSPPTSGRTMTRSGSSLLINGTNTRLSGMNAYWVGLNDNAGTSSGSFPSQSTLTSAFQGMKEMGVTLVRAHTIGISTGNSKSFETAAGVYSDANMDSADWAVYQAGLKGISLMVPLTDNWNYYHGGKWNFVHWAYQQNSSGITDTPGGTKDDINERIFFANTTAGLRVRALFKDYISHLLNHVNPYTGLAYKDDPTIAIIETGNEIYYASQLGTNEWTQDIASYVKSIAPNKLVADGSAADRVAVSSQPGLSASSVDIVGGHYYPQQQSGSYPPVEFTNSSAGYPAGTALQQLAADATAATNAGKAFIVGEYPWTRSTVSQFYSAIEGNSAVDADMAWSFVAGSETHGGSFGSDDFPVHRPYLSGSEATYGPVLATHISTVSGVAKTNGA